MTEKKNIDKNQNKKQKQKQKQNEKEPNRKSQHTALIVLYCC